METHENLSLENIDGEIWKEIEGYDGNYYISNYGRVKSFKKWNGTGVRILSLLKDKDGYSYIHLCKNGEKPKNKRIHILMYENHIEKIQEGCVIHHIDFTKNNILDNLQMMTNEEHSRLHQTGNHPSEKTKELMRNKIVSEETKELMSEKKKGENNPMFGTKRPGEDNPNHILTEQKVIEIRKLCDERVLTQKEIGEKFGVDQTQISRIKNRKNWKYVE